MSGSLVSWRRVCSLSCIVIAVGSLPARAQVLAPAPASNVEEIKALVEDGSAEYALGHFREALNDFEKAYKLRRLAKLLFNIAQCHRQLKEFDEAAVTLRSFLRLADAGSTQANDARALLAQVEEAIKAQNKAQVAPPLDDNGRDSPVHVATTAPPPPQPIAKPAPVVTVEPIAPPPVAIPTSTPTSPAPPIAIETAPAVSRRRVPIAVAWATGGAGVAALGAGAVFGLMSKSTASDLTSSQHTRPEIADLQSKLASQAATANVLFVAGGVLVAVSAALFVFKF